MTTKEYAPQWTSTDHDGRLRTSKEFLGSWLLLYFYPKDDTPGCTIEACGFRDAWSRLALLAHIVGVSGDSLSSHQQFRSKYSLPFPLLSDTDGTLRSAFQVDGKVHPTRVTFLINPEGKIEKIYKGFDCNDHATQVERDLLSLSQRIQ